MEMQLGKEDLSEEAVRAYVAGISQSLRERGEHWKGILSTLRAGIEPYRTGPYTVSYQATVDMIEMFDLEVEWLAKMALAIAPPPLGGSLSPH